MKDIEMKINIELAQLDELAADDQELVRMAMKATDNSYAKYSHFRVGAAVLLADGSVVIGANQENAVFPLGLCAERTAIFAAQVLFLWGWSISQDCRTQALSLCPTSCLSNQSSN